MSTQSHSATITQTASATPNTLPTSQTPEVQALVKNSVECYRNGKTYEVAKGDNFDCLAFRTEVEAVIQKYEQSKPQN